MQSNNPKPFYCHGCKKTVPIYLPALSCPECQSEVLQEANMLDSEPMQTSRQIPILDIFSMFSDGRHQTGLTRRFLERIRETDSNREHNVPFRIVIRELMERSGRAVPASRASIENIRRVIVTDNEDIQCNICFDSFLPGEKKDLLQCGHGFHSQCLKPWLDIKNICPVCKQSF